MGSGFIIDADCHVITNRHVVETDGARVANTVASSAEMARARIAVAEQQLRANIVQQLQLRRSLVGEPGTNLQVIEIDERVQAMKEELADLPERVKPRYQPESGRVGPQRLHGDGGGTVPSSTRCTPRTPTIGIWRSFNCPPITVHTSNPGNSGALAQGERPVHHRQPLRTCLQRDVGNFSPAIAVRVRSGSCRPTRRSIPATAAGPLIRENGEVVGINTLVLQGAQGIGFAIPDRGGSTRSSCSCAPPAALRRARPPRGSVLGGPVRGARRRRQLIRLVHPVIALDTTPVSRELAVDVLDVFGGPLGNLPEVEHADAMQLAFEQPWGHP